MEFLDPGEPFVQKHIDLLWNEEFNLPRYCRLYDRANRWRFPVIFWGVQEVGPIEAQPDPAYITALGALLKRLKDRRTSDGAQAYVIWHSQILTRYLGTADVAVRALFKREVIDQIDAFYQHEIPIPAPSQPLTWREAGMKPWEEFPHVTMDPARNLDETRSTQDRIKASLQDTNKDNHLIASDGFPLPVIPGCMPQYSRERYTYFEHAKKLDTLVKQSRVNCTHPKQLLQTLQSMADLAETNRLIQDGLSWTVRRIVTLTSWNEWREGTAWEPGAPDSNDPNIFGLTDTEGLFLTQAKKAFATRKLKYTIGDKKRPGPEPGPM